ncbi:hypothetical protein BU26DRAFT_570900 [Trematosphaeria pertusa]|uniref:Uncharacterized protein n=1 Tax=Trematosphaeria pertusa TaxID=390896 RepID=A0A6A6HX90_9PLEO|nr:uncharacterized protein BU26DRAFT_570900 [Trematosphaeria pertusa]KAF2242213.1 hypothetical protein BU26DRAFT_570900 [Trematosphaeria pertusa]
MGTRAPDRDRLSWTFFEIDVGKEANACGGTVDFRDESKEWYEGAPEQIVTPPWPHGNFGPMKLYGEECTYSANGENPGILNCKNFLKAASYHQDNKKEQGAEIVGHCGSSAAGSEEYEVHPVAFCEW